MNTKHNTQETVKLQQEQPTEENNQNKQSYGKIELDERSHETTKVELIENTPFMARWIKDKGWAYGIGGDRISQWFKTKEEMIKNIKKGGINWVTVTAIVQSLIKHELERIEIEKRSNKN